MRHYYIKNVALLVNGVPLDFFGEGDDVIKVERLSPSAMHKMSADGKMAIALSADRSGKLTVKLMQTSDGNTYLTNLIGLQEGGTDTFVPVRFTAKDSKLNDIAVGSPGYIEKPADMIRGQNVNEHEWSFIVEDLRMVFGAQSVPPTT